MRDILFRGKDYQNQWVYGYLIHGDSNKPNLYSGYYILKDGFTESFHCIDSIDKSTVCQYSELSDKNGKMIFEGDIISCERVWTKSILGVVKFHKSSFSVEWLDENYSHDFLGYLPSVEVVGNVFDNPELLKKNDEKNKEELAPVVHAKWIKKRSNKNLFAGNFIGIDFYCSNCNKESIISFDYCPHCGAKIDLED